jgi:hypothetical protein
MRCQRSNFTARPHFQSRRTHTTRSPCRILPGKIEHSSRTSFSPSNERQSLHAARPFVSDPPSFHATIPQHELDVAESLPSSSDGETWTHLSTRLLCEQFERQPRTLSVFPRCYFIAHQTRSRCGHNSHRASTAWAQVNLQRPASFFRGTVVCIQARPRIQGRKQPAAAPKQRCRQTSSLARTSLASVETSTMNQTPRE